MSLIESRRAAEAASPFTNPWTEPGPNGPIVLDAGQYLRTDPEWVRRNQPDMVHGDELWLDRAGEWRYRPSDDPRLQKLAAPKTAYERVHP